MHVEENYSGSAGGCGGEIPMVRTGFAELDNLIGGLCGGDLVLVAARPGVGKTTFALNVARNAALAGSSVLFFSLEAPAWQVWQKLVCSEAHLEQRQVIIGDLSDIEVEALAAARAYLSDGNLHIENVPTSSVSEICSCSRRQMGSGKPGLDLIVIDSLNLLDDSPSQVAEKRWWGVGGTVRALKDLAMELNVPVIAIEPLSRAIEMRGGRNKRPRLADLRRSSSLEQVSDIVLLLDRSLDAEEAEENGRPDLGLADVSVAKNRHGKTGEVTLAFCVAPPRFMDYYAC